MYCVGGKDYTLLYIIPPIYIFATLYILLLFVLLLYAYYAPGMRGRMDEGEVLLFEYVVVFVIRCGVSLAEGLEGVTHGLGVDFA